MSEIKKTNDYSIFKLLDCNRSVNEKKKRKLIDSILEKNFLHRRPILCTANMEIIDGQHRLEAAAELGIPVYYQIDPDAKAEDIILLNDAVTPWNPKDYLNFYVKKGVRGYVQLERLSKKYGLVCDTIVRLTAPSSADIQGFKRGKWKEIDEAEFERKMGYLIDLKNLVKSTLDHRESAFLSTRTFLRAFWIFISLDDVDIDLFQHKLKLRPFALRHGAVQSDYLRMFKNIYNFKNQNPIDIG